AIFLFNQSFRSYPDEIIEAARMDGFSEMEICWGLVLRGSLPSLAAFSVFSLVAHWNDLYWPMIVISDTNLAPPPLGMMFFADVESGANYGALMAGATLITAPM
ncbi:ABC transporter permease subunit, partial [Mesorhizobium sp. M8A.F.Ca.ET.181.01.1.1]